MKPTSCRLTITIATLVAILGLFLAAAPALANGAPVDICLSYMPGTSNWGPEELTGTAVVGVADAEITIEIEGMPQLEAGQYEAWLQSRADRKLYSMGTFVPDSSGVVHYHAFVDDLPYQEYRMLVITVEDVPDPSPEPSERWSLAGMFPNAAIVQVTESSLTAPGGAEQPPLLPTTGASIRQWLLPIAAIVGAVLLVTAVALHRFSRGHKEALQ